MPPRPLLLALVLAASWLHAASAQAPVPDLPYGPKPYQLFDWYPGADEPGLPAGPKPWVLFAHGTGTDKSGISIQSFAVMLDLLRRNGVTVFAANWGNYPEIYPTPLHDLARAIQHIKANASAYEIDKDEFVLWGNSGGATIGGWLAYGDDLADPTGTEQEQQSTRPIAYLNWNGLTNFLLMHPLFSALSLGAQKLEDLPQEFLRDISISEMVIHNTSRAFTPPAQSYYSNVSGPPPYQNPHDLALMEDFHLQLDTAYPAVAAQSMKGNNPFHPHVILSDVDELADWTLRKFGLDAPLRLGHETKGTLTNPKLWASESPTAGGDLVLSFRAGVPIKVPVLFIAGFKRDDLEVPPLDVYIVPEQSVLFPLLSNPVGKLDLNIKVPGYMPAGIVLYLQAVHPDVGASKGLAATNALRIKTQ